MFFEKNSPTPVDVSGHGSWKRGALPVRFTMDRIKSAISDRFEQILVVVLVASLLLIHFFVDYKLAFLSFYYLPIITAGFLLGKKGAVWAAVLAALLVTFFSAVTGLGGMPGLSPMTLNFLVPWGGFLILTGYTVGTLSDQRKERAEDVKQTYLVLLELLTFHLDSADRQRRGHSYRVAERAIAIGRQLALPAQQLEELRVAALLHELGPQDPQLARLFADFPREIHEVPVAASMGAALDIVNEYGRYHELVGTEWPVDALRIPMGVKILAVADAYETLLAPTDTRPAFAPWNALEEMDRGAGSAFATQVVQALRAIAVPQRVDIEPGRPALKLIVTRRPA